MYRDTISHTHTCTNCMHDDQHFLLAHHETYLMSQCTQCHICRCDRFRSHYICIYVCVHVHVCMYACTHMCMYVCMYVIVCMPRNSGGLGLSTLYQ